MGMGLSCFKFGLGSETLKLMDDQYFTGLATEFSAKLRRVSSFTKHAVSIGSYHEEAVKTVLRSMLANRFTLKTGFL